MTLWNTCFCACLICYIVFRHLGDILFATRTNQDDFHRRTVLVTGGAGFIGYSVAKRLLSDVNSRVIVVDSFVRYYDPVLKLARAHNLSLSGHVTIYKADVCNESQLAELFTRYRFTDVIHMAAMAGVRYSVKKPLAYVRNNIQCQMALLNVLKQHKGIHLVYASSSSVYGQAATVPFSPQAPKALPSNIYAASKLAAESLVRHYCSVYNVHAVGLRFFTVYGPWGRPDMAIYAFARDILEHHAIPVFYSNSSQRMARDFTYIDDVVDGIIAAMDLPVTQCGVALNIGFGRPTHLTDMISILQSEIGINADLDYQPVPATEMLQTWAELSDSERQLHYQPRINITTGIRQFVDWLSWYQQRNVSTLTDTPDYIATLS